MEELIDVENISLSFMRDGVEFKVIDNISFKLYEGEFLSIVGPSGCGKSSLIRIITGLLKPTSGKVMYLNKEVSSPPAGISLVFQNFALFPWMTSIENVELALVNSKMSEAEKEKKSIAALKQVNLIGFERAYPSELSGGMKQRVGIARAIVSDPKVILMDEPFSSLDDLTAEQLRGEVHHILKSKEIPVKGVIMVSHNVDEVVELSDRVIILSRPPSHIVDIIEIREQYPRDKHSKKMVSITNRIYDDLYSAEQ